MQQQNRELTEYGYYCLAIFYPAVVAASRSRSAATHSKASTLHLQPWLFGVPPNSGLHMLQTKYHGSPRRFTIIQVAQCCSLISVLFAAKAMYVPRAVDRQRAKTSLAGPHPDSPHAPLWIRVGVSAVEHTLQQQRENIHHTVSLHDSLHAARGLLRVGWLATR